MPQKTTDLDKPKSTSLIFPVTDGTGSTFQLLNTSQLRLHQGSPQYKNIIFSRLMIFIK